jgi:uncharacterized protein YjbI with pentapeptide repeats
MKKVLFIFVGLLMVSNSFAQSQKTPYAKPPGFNPYAGVTSEEHKKMIRQAMLDFQANQPITGMLGNVDLSKLNVIKVDTNPSDDFIYAAYAPQGLSLKGSLHGINLEKMNANKIWFTEYEGLIYVERVESPTGQFLKGPINMINVDHLQVAVVDFKSALTLRAAPGKTITGKLDTNSDGAIDDELELGVFKANEITLEFLEEGGKFQLSKFIAPENQTLVGNIYGINLTNLNANQFRYMHFCSKMFEATAPVGKVLSGVPYGVNLNGLNANHVEFILGSLTKAEASEGQFLRSVFKGVDLNQFNAFGITHYEEDFLYAYAFENSQITGSYNKTNLTDLKARFIAIDINTDKITMAVAEGSKILGGYLRGIQLNGINAGSIYFDTDTLTIYANEGQSLSGKIYKRDLAGLPAIKMAL